MFHSGQSVNGIIHNGLVVTQLTPSYWAICNVMVKVSSQISVYSDATLINQVNWKKASVCSKEEKTLTFSVFSLLLR